jgi:DNA-binding transcriptional ArsR family regulator
MAFAARRSDRLRATRKRVAYLYRDFCRCRSVAESATVDRRSRSRSAAYLREGHVRPTTEIYDPRLAKALGHPLRAGILAALERDPASPSALARELSAPLGKVSYHVRILADCGLITLVGRTRRRGAFEHHYKAVPASELPREVWAGLPGVVQTAMAGATLREIAAQVNSAAEQGGFSRPSVHVTYTPLVVDERGFERLSTSLEKQRGVALRIQEESARRLKRANQVGERVAHLVLMLFEAGDSGGDPDEGATAGAGRRTGSPARRR